MLSLPEVQDSQQWWCPTRYHNGYWWPRVPFYSGTNRRVVLFILQTCVPGDERCPPLHHWKHLSLQGLHDHVVEPWQGGKRHLAELPETMADGWGQQIWMRPANTMKPRMLTWKTRSIWWSVVGPFTSKAACIWTSSSKDAWCLTMWLSESCSSCSQLHLMDFETKACCQVHISDACKGKITLLEQLQLEKVVATSGTKYPWPMWWPAISRCPPVPVPLISTPCSWDNSPQNGLGPHIKWSICGRPTKEPIQFCQHRLLFGLLGGG